jgi:hypothetical protein
VVETPAAEAVVETPTAVAVVETPAAEAVAETPASEAVVEAPAPTTPPRVVRKALPPLGRPVKAKAEGVSVWGKK